MSDMDKLAGPWVEIKERAEGDDLVLMRPDAGVPPSRGGRRMLQLGARGEARAMAQGAVDRMEDTAAGGWAAAEDTLKLQLDGWEGEYSIETKTDTELILKRR